MSNVLILGANGQVARYAIDLFLKETDARLTLYLRNSRRLRSVDRNRARVIEGDVLDGGKLTAAMAGQESVVSRKSVAALVVKLAESPELEVRRRLGVSKP